MRHILTHLYYKGPADVDWTDIGLVSGHGTLEIATTSTETGLVKTYKLKATLSRELRPGRLPLHRDMKLMAVYDNGVRVQLGTDDLPVRLDIMDSDVLSISCNWEKGL